MKWIAALFIALAFAGCVESQGEEREVEGPVEESSHQVRTNVYRLQNQVIQGQFGVYVVDLEAKTYDPGITDAPLILIMHGRHGTCSLVGIEQLVPLCPSSPVTAPVDSHLGYDAIGHQLAGAGFFVASVDANGVNDLDNNWGQLGDDYGASARVAVLQAHYDYLMENNDLSGTVGLIGHSRGGEAVNLAATTLQPTPSAIMSIAPTDFADHDVEQVPFLVILPECDGDVSDLQGMDVYRRGYENAGPRYQVWMAGANHNFFNTIWTSDDAGFRYSEGLCADENRRYNIPEQTKVGAEIALSFFQKEMAGIDDKQLWSLDCHWTCDENRPIHLLTNVGTPFKVPCSAVESFRASPTDACTNITHQLEAATWTFSAAQISTADVFTVDGEDWTTRLAFSDDSSHKTILRTFMIPAGTTVQAEGVVLGDHAYI